MSNSKETMSSLLLSGALGQSSALSSGSPNNNLSPPTLLSSAARRRSVSTAVLTSSQSKQLASLSPPSPASNRKSQLKEAVLAALKDVMIPGVTCDNLKLQEIIKLQQNSASLSSSSQSGTFGGDQQQLVTAITSSSSFSSPVRGRLKPGQHILGGTTNSSTTSSHQSAILSAIIASATPVGTEEIRELTDDDHKLLAELDAREVAPLLAFLKETAPDIYGELPARYTPEIAEDIIDRLIVGDDVTGSKQRKRGMTAARWGAVKSFAQGVGSLINTPLSQQLHHSAQVVLLTSPNDGTDEINNNNNNNEMMNSSQNNNNNSNPLLGGKRSSFISSSMNQSVTSSLNQSTTNILLLGGGDQNQQSSNHSPHSLLHRNQNRGSMILGSTTKKVAHFQNDNSFDHLHGTSTFGSSSPNHRYQYHHHQDMMNYNNSNNNNNNISLSKFEVEAAERERKILSVLNGVQKISERHRERTFKLRMANRDIADVAVQVVSTPGVKVVTTTGRPPPSHAVDAVGGIKHQMTTTRGEPPLMVLRQELEDRQALAAAMPRIRARVAEIMGKLSSKNNSNNNLKNNNNNTSNTSSIHHQQQPGKIRPSSSATKRTPNAHVGNFFSHSANTQQQRPASASISNKKAKKRPSSTTTSPIKNSDRDISEIAKRLRLRSESLAVAAEEQHKETVEKRRVASQLRRELVQQGLWVDVRILSMFRPPTQVKAFVASWSEFRQLIVEAVAPLPPGCAFASLSYLSGPGAKSVLDPRHPLLRPLRGFEVIRGCKTRVGTCATLTVSVAIRNSAETAGLPQDFEV